MTGLLPLFLLWAWGRGSGGGGAQNWQVHVGPPTIRWPTAASPPPTPPPAMPAFTPQPTPPTAETATPLSELAQPNATKHAPPPVAKSPAAPGPVVPKARKKKPPATPAQAALRAAKARAPAAALKRAKGGLSLATPAASVQKTVLELQKILNGHGATLKPDGLYGPQTAGTWHAFSKKKGLAGTISRVGPKIAKVVQKTYDALKVPPIP